MDELRTHNFSNPDNAKFFYWRIAIVVAGILFLIFYVTVSIDDLPSTDWDCYYDLFFAMTAAINSWFHDNISCAQALLIVAQESMDILALSTLIRWAMFGKSLMPIVTIVMFYFMRWVCTVVFIIEYPDGYLWEYPGFPSLFVSYKQAYDFFFSGHLAFCMWNVIHHYNEKHKVHMLYSIYVTILTFTAQVFLRGHYIIDLLTGMVVAHYCHLVCSLYFGPWCDSNIIVWLDDDKNKLYQRA